MELHANAALSLNKRRLLARRVVGDGWSSGIWAKTGPRKVVGPHAPAEGVGQALDSSSPPAQSNIRMLADIPSVRAASYLAQADYEEVIAEVLLRSWTRDPLVASGAAAAVMATMRRAQEAIAADPKGDPRLRLDAAYRVLERGLGKKPVV